MEDLSGLEKDRGHILKTLYQLLCEALEKKDEDQKFRDHTSAAFSEITDSRSMEQLIELLEAGDTDSRIGVLSALEQIADKRSVEALVRVLEDKDEESLFRGFAADTLGRIGNKLAVEPLLRALEDEEPIVRSTAAHALGEIGDNRAVVPLLEALKRKDKSEDDLKQPYQQLFVALKDRPELGTVVEAVIDVRWNFRIQVALALGKLDDERTVRSLVQSLLTIPPGEDFNSFFIFAAAVLHVFSPPAELLEPLKTLEPLLLSFILSDCDQEIKEAARDLLGLLE
ncbi:MAG: HEAT repeat domain-containing protein [Candidatus Odinarchaeota archaeon]